MTKYLASAALAAALALVPAGAAAADGWLYIHKYLSRQQAQASAGIASAPFWFYDSNGALIPSSRPDGRQEPGTLVKVPAGDYYVVAGNNNVGLTRVKYTVVGRKATVVQTGFVSVSTWRDDEQPKVDCSPWDAEMTAFVAALDTPDADPKAPKWLPTLSNPAVEFKTRDFGMLQLPVGRFQILWHGFTHDVEIKEGEVYRLPLGTAGPLGEDRPKARLSERKGDAADNPTLNLCADGPTHVIGGAYFLSYMQQLDVFPYEERVWTQIDVEATNKHGYVRKLKPDGVGKSIYRGEGAAPTAAYVAKLAVPKAGAAGPDAKTREKADSLLGGDGGIDWDAPP